MPAAGSLGRDDAVESLVIQLQQVAIVEYRRAMEHAAKGRHRSLNHRDKGRDLGVLTDIGFHECDFGTRITKTAKGGLILGRRHAATASQNDMPGTVVDNPLGSRQT